MTANGFIHLIHGSLDPHESASPQWHLNQFNRFLHSSLLYLKKTNTQNMLHARRQWGGPGGPGPPQEKLPLSRLALARVFPNVSLAMCPPRTFFGPLIARLWHRRCTCDIYSHRPHLCTTCRQCGLIILLPCDAMLQQYMLSSFVSLSVRPFICPSVTVRYCTKTAKCRITWSTPYDRPGTLVYWC